MSVSTKAILLVLAVALAIIAGINSYIFFHFAQAPLVMSEAAITNSPVKSGDNLLIRYTAERQTLCRADGDVFILRDGTLVYHERRPAGLMPLGASTGSIQVPTTGLPAGKYIVRIFIHNDCGDRLHTIEVPDLVFEVVD